MKKKELYEAPSVETYDIVPENNVLLNGSPTYGSANTAGSDLVEQEDYTYTH